MNDITQIGYFDLPPVTLLALSQPANVSLMKLCHKIWDPLPYLIDVIYDGSLKYYVFTLILTTQF